MTLPESVVTAAVPDHSRIRVAVLLLIALIAAAALTAPALVARYRAREFSPVMHAYVEAGVAGDSMALERVSVTQHPVLWALSMHRRDPALFQLAALGLRPVMLDTANGMTRVQFRFRHSYVAPNCASPFDGIYAAFRRVPKGWLLVQAGIGPC
ncbi:MAG: hypothetical protein H0U85_04400 [Gemmatimonadales bacterium]|nr:hypothetical protein [Gemmatimonadales bacterium]